MKTSSILPRSLLVAGGSLAIAACTLVYAREDYASGGPPALDAGGADVDVPDAGSADASSCAFSTPVHEIVNEATGARLFTVTPADAVRIAGSGYSVDRGVVFRVATAGGARRVPVYQIHNPETGDRLYTVSASEKEPAARNGYTKDEGIAFYAAGSPGPCLVPVYGYQRRSIHRLAASVDERNTLLGEGWSQEGPRFYAGAP